MTSPQLPAHPYQPASPPPQGWAPPKKNFWKTTPGILLLVFGGTIGLVVLLCGGAVALGVAGNRDALSKMDVKLTSCEFTGSDTLPMGTVGYSVTNNGKKAQSVSIKIEYRDGSGARIDTDTAYVRSVAPGDTVSGEESTILDGKPTGTAECRITGIS